MLSDIVMILWGMGGGNVSYWSHLLLFTERANPNWIIQVTLALLKHILKTPYFDIYTDSNIGRPRFKNFHVKKFCPYETDQIWS
jgi:hypothetical protein